MNYNAYYYYHIIAHKMYDMLQKCLKIMNTVINIIGTMSGAVAP